MPEFATRQLDSDDLFALRYVHDARLSPDGRRVAYVTSRTVAEAEEEFFEIAIDDLAGGARRELAFAGRASFPRWSPDGNRLAFVGLGERSSRVYLADPDTHAMTALTPDGLDVKGAPAWSPDGATIVFTVMSRREPEGLSRITTRHFRAEGLGEVHDLTLALHLVDAVGGEVRPLDVGMAVATQPAFSPCGRRILFLGTRSVEGYPDLSMKPFVLDLDDGDLGQVLGEGWYVAHAGWSPCGERIVVAGDFESPLIYPIAGLWVVGRDGSDPQRRTDDATSNLGLLAHHDMPTWGASENDMFVVADGDHAYATVMTHGCAQICRVALHGPVSCEPVVRGPRTCVIMDAGAAVSTLLYAVSDLHTPWELCRSDLDGGRERRLTDLNSMVLAGWPALASEHLEFSSDDGLPLEGWFLSRADRQGPQPTVLFVHGGPELAVGNVFRFDFHLLAANGYAVAFSNFRGSAGYGEAFMLALKGDWGGLGFPDHMAAADAAVAAGMADAERMGVWGPSHGGFATAWIVGHTSRFRAAVAESSVTNMASFYYLSDMPQLVVRDLGGRPDEIADIYRSRSPLTYAPQCRTPTLMLHGEDDLRCPIAEAEQFHRALHDAGCVTELARIPGMNHMGDSVGPLPARRAQNDALLEWFERHL